MKSFDAEVCVSWCVCMSTYDRIYEARDVKRYTVKCVFEYYINNIKQLTV